MTQTTDEIFTNPDESAPDYKVEVIPAEKQAAKPGNVISLNSHRKGAKKWDNFKAQTNARVEDGTSLSTAENPTPDNVGTLRWVDVYQIDPNPYQPRLSYDNDELLDLINQLNSDGQTQPAVGREHPTEKGRIQLIAGHRRWKAVSVGALQNTDDEESRIYANAGTKQPNPKRFAGKLLVLVREGDSELEVRRIAYSENNSRSDLKPIEKAKFFLGTRTDLTIKLGKKASWRAVAEFLNENYQVIHRIAQLMELPPNMIEALEKGTIIQSHGEALVQLRHWPEHQRGLFSDIFKHGWNGSHTEKVAAARIKELNEKAPTDYSLAEEAVANATARNNVSAATQAEAETRRAGFTVVASSTAQVTTTDGSQQAVTTAESQETRTASAVAQIPKLPQQTLDQLQLAISMMESATVGLEMLEISPDDFPRYQEKVNKLDRLTTRSKKALKAKGVR